MARDRLGGDRRTGGLRLLLGGDHVQGLLDGVVGGAGEPDEGGAPGHGATFACRGVDGVPYLGEYVVVGSVHR
ncbi:hypothetical protein DMH04_55755 [Kibdelosporangium aridum]|uniref:Uncharacterized protein n=1 Tax=Kibdelosporangium aridum TaxID=2030 RepID=A0A428XW55_KIBAR|nr:hypothetical protein DMH04_55755 [Kibdelosporangium aridum]